MSEVVLTLTDINKTYTKGKRSAREVVRAARNVTLSLKKQHILSIVGESGSGKTTLARLITGIERPDSGTITFSGRPATGLSGRRLMVYRREVQMIFQDPFASLNPLSTIAYTLERPLVNYLKMSRRDALDRVRELLEIVNLTPAATYLDKLPFELSGGQLQRVGIARALASNPTLIVADEPVSMLDVSIRAEILSLLDRLRTNQGVSMIYITHDLVSARALADEVAVVYRGKIVEYGSASHVVQDPKHPYTQLLLRSIPNPWHPDEQAAVEPPTQGTQPTKGCVFQNRCPFVTDRCREQSPALVGDETLQSVACFLHSDKAEHEVNEHVLGRTRG